MNMHVGFVLIHVHYNSVYRFTSIHFTQTPAFSSSCLTNFCWNTKLWPHLHNDTADFCAMLTWCHSHNIFTWRTDAPWVVNEWGGYIGQAQCPGGEHCGCEEMRQAVGCVSRVFTKHLQIQQLLCIVLVKALLGAPDFRNSFLPSTPSSALNDPLSWVSSLLPISTPMTVRISSICDAVMLLTTSLEVAQRWDVFLNLDTSYLSTHPRNCIFVCFFRTPWVRPAPACICRLNFYHSVCWLKIGPCWCRHRSASSGAVKSTYCTLPICSTLFDRCHGGGDSTVSILQRLNLIRMFSRPVSVLKVHSI